MHSITIYGEQKTCSQLSEDLVVGSVFLMRRLERDGWVCVCLAACTPWEPAKPGFKSVLIDGTGNSDAQIQEIVCKVCHLWSAGRRVAILCRSGANRSPAIAAGSLWASGRATSVYGAIEWMRGKRGEVGHYKGTTSEVEFAVSKILAPIKIRPEYFAKHAT